jgi:hypothetical protein
MITFQIVLTTSQIAVLQAIQQQNAVLDRYGLHSGEFTKLREKGQEAEEEYMEISRNISGHFITSARALMREGLVHWSKKEGHFITEKGILTLRLIEMDIEEMRTSLKDVKRLRPAKVLKK